MEIIDLPPTRLDLPGGGDPVYVVTQRWALEPWEGEDPPELGRTWSRKGKFSVNGRRSCAELAVVHHLRDYGWHGIWVNAYGPRELRSDWFPAPAVKTITQTGAPPWAAEIFEALRAANDGKVGGFFDVFAWREPGEVRFDEVKVGRDPIGLNQRKFVKLALDLDHRLDEFTIIKVTEQGPAARERGHHRTDSPQSANASTARVSALRRTGMSTGQDLAETPLKRNQRTNVYALLVNCSYCGAKPGQRCYGAKSHPKGYLNTLHKDREHELGRRLDVATAGLTQAQAAAVRRLFVNPSTAEERRAVMQVLLQPELIF